MTQAALSQRALALKQDAEQRLTMTIPQAAKRLGIGRNQGYEAAKAGQIPTIQIGKRKLVPVAAFEAMLAVKSRQELVATELVRRLRDEPEAA